MNKAAKIKDCKLKAYDLYKLLEQKGLPMAGWNEGVRDSHLCIRIYVRKTKDLGKVPKQYQGYEVIPVSLEQIANYKRP